MSAIGTFVKFKKIEGNYTNDDLMHGEVVSFGEKVEAPLNIGDKIVISTVKKNQDIQNGQTYYYVNESQIMDI